MIIPSIELTFPLILTIILEGILSAFALWKSGRNNQLGWFIAVLVFNTAGILPAIYLLFFQPKKIIKKKILNKKR